MGKRLLTAPIGQEQQLQKQDEHGEVCSGTSNCKRLQCLFDPMHIKAQA